MTHLKRTVLAISAITTDATAVCKRAARKAVLWTRTSAAACRRLWTRLSEVGASAFPVLYPGAEGAVCPWSRLRRRQDLRLVQACQWLSRLALNRLPPAKG